MDQVFWKDEKFCAERYGKSRSWFQRARWAGNGPPYLKVGNSVRYNIKVTDEWFNARVISSTSQGPRRKRKPVPPQLREPAA